LDLRRHGPYRFDHTFSGINYLEVYLSIGNLIRERRNADATWDETFRAFLVGKLAEYVFPASVILSIHVRQYSIVAGMV
jgi:hypothetical protein